MDPDRRRRVGAAAIVVGLVLGVAGRLVHLKAVEAAAAIAATLLIVGGGVMIASAYREESGRPRRATSGPLSALRASGELARAKAGSLAHVKTGGPAATAAGVGSGSPGSDGTTASLRGFGAVIEQALDDAVRLLDAEPPASVASLTAAREKLMTLVANPRFGQLLAAQLVDEPRLREISTRFADRLVGPASS